MDQLRAVKVPLASMCLFAFWVAGLHAKVANRLPNGGLSSNCNAAYLSKANPDFDPQGPLPHGPYIPFRKFKESLVRDTPEELDD